MPEGGAAELGTRSAGRRGACAGWLVAVLGTVTSAALFGLAFPPARWTPLAWVALVPWLLAVRGAGPGRALTLGFVWGVLAAWSVGDWMPRAVTVYFGQPVLVGYLFFLAIAATMASPYYMAFAWSYARLARRLPPAAVVAVGAAAWVAIELGRGRLFTGSAFFIGNPWALLGYSQRPHDGLMQLASLAGVYGISFVVAAANVAVAESVAAGARRRWRRAAPALAVAAGLAASAWGLGAALLAGAPTEPMPAPAEAVPIAIVQGDVRLEARWRPEFYGRNLDVYLRGTTEAILDAAPRVVFWPESALTFFLEDEPLYRWTIARTLRAADTELVAGGPRSEPGPPERHFNTVFLVRPDGEIAARYDKQYLVPFSETFPFGRIDLLRRRFERVRVFTPGADAALLSTRAGAAGVLICNEAMLPEVAAARVRAGAELLVNPSNDTWIPSRRFAEQLFDIVSLRAVEQRRFLVRASTSGPSAIVDPWGRVQVRSAPFTADVLLGTVAPRQGATVYARLGDTFAVSCVVLAAGALALTRRRRG